MDDQAVFIQLKALYKKEEKKSSSGTQINNVTIARNPKTEDTQTHVGFVQLEQTHSKIKCVQLKHSHKGNQIIVFPIIAV